MTTTVINATPESVIDEPLSLKDKDIRRKLAKTIFVRVAIGVAVHFATTAVITAIENRQTKNVNEDQPK